MPKIKVLGYIVDTDLIKNPHVRRAIRERANCFLFNYGDKAGYEDYNHTETSGGLHSDHINYGDYSERIGHSDESKDSPVQSYHVDETSGHTEHNDSYSDTTYQDMG